MALILNSSLSSPAFTIEPGACVHCDDEQRLIDAGAARPLTDVDKPDKMFDLDEGIWKPFKPTTKKAKS